MATRVLLVEDVEDLRALTAEVLQSSGYDVTAVAGPEQARRLLFRGADGVRPDVIVLDLLLAGTSGLSFLQELRDRIPVMPAVVAMSGHPGALAEAAALE